MEVYLDNSATTRPFDEVIEAVSPDHARVLLQRFRCL